MTIRGALSGGGIASLALLAAACGQGYGGDHPQPSTSAAVAVAAAVSVNTSSATSSVAGIPCTARAEAVIANTGAVASGSGSLVDSYESSLGPYGGTNIGSQAVVQAATSIAPKSGVIHGTVTQGSPAGLGVVPVPSGAINLPLGSPTPGSLNINNAAQSITLAPGSYVAANINVNFAGAINISPPGPVLIWVTGNLNLGGNENPNGVPANLQFLVQSSGFVNVNSGGQLFGFIYAPTSVVSLGSAVFGGVVGSSVNLNSGAAVHYDQSSACVATVPDPNLSGNSNYWLTNGTSCAAIQNLTVDIQVTHDITFLSGSTNNPGFDFQLNAWSSAASAGSSNPALEQYVFGLVTSNLCPNAPAPFVLQGSVEYFKVMGELFNAQCQPTSVGPSIPQLLNLASPSLSAGDDLKIQLQNDSSGNITGVTWTVTTATGTTSSTFSVSSAGPFQAPIAAIQLTLDGPNGGESDVLASGGAAIVTYSASTPLTAMASLPTCVATRNITAESSNAVYSLLPQGASTTFTQSFSVP